SSTRIPSEPFEYLIGYERPELELGADLPEFGKEPLAERGLQVADAGRSAGARLVADLPLDHFDMPDAPEPEALVVVQQRFRKVEQIRVTIALTVDVLDGHAPPA